jgi:hypothetical protein
MKKFVFVCLMTFSFANARDVVLGSWFSDGHEAIVVQSMGISGNPNILYTSLVFEYSPQTNCEEGSVSVISSKDKKLGKFISNDFKDANKSSGNKMNFYIDGKELIYTADRTVRVIYDNGAQFGTKAPKNLIGTLIASRGQFEAKIGNATLISFSKMRNIEEAFESAKKYCLKFKK